MKNNPFFSVILPTYNRSGFIGKAIDSVLTQIFTDFELIIIDDGSTDNTKEVVSSFSDERISYYYQKNQERSVSRNNGIQKAQGTYICFLDSDDYFLPSHLSVLYANIEKNNFTIALFHTYQQYVRNGRVEDMICYDNYINHDLLETDCRLINNVWLFSPSIQTTAIHKNICSNILFDSYPIPFECYEFMGRVAAFYNVVKIPEKTVLMQLHENNSTVYDVRFLESSKTAFEYILSSSIYSNIKNHFSVKEKFYSIYIGLADCYSRSGNKIVASKYLLKGLLYKTNFKNIRQLLGIARNVFLFK
ncbi:MAG: glycosyltransferase family 2 protein [Bacteroidetes bacterium]|nr:glycosyltransferase family 2 protein [Bacteroidota bacterium]